MHIALIDDEQGCIDELSKICREFGRENCIDTKISPFPDGESFLCSLEVCDGYDIVFMDIFMRGMDGVTAAKRLRLDNTACILIFLTACGERMPEAFSCHAFEYIIKPFTPRRVRDVLKDAMALLPQTSGYIDVYSDRKTVRVPYENIVSAVTDAHYLEIRLCDGTTLRSRLTIPEFIARTGDPRFLSINKGVVVNADYIIGFEENCCLLENGRFSIRVRNRLKVEQLFLDYNFEKMRRRTKRDG